MNGKGNKNSFIMAHNEIGEQLWLRTVDGSGKFQVSPLPSNGTATIKLPFKTLFTLRWHKGALGNFWPSELVTLR
jgi:hypothetical protein